jgi:hypothetical protein
MTSRCLLRASRKHIIMPIFAKGALQFTNAWIIIIDFHRVLCNNTDQVRLALVPLTTPQDRDCSSGRTLANCSMHNANFLDQATTLCSRKDARIQAWEIHSGSKSCIKSVRHNSEHCIICIICISVHKDVVILCTVRPTPYFL